MLAPKRTKFRKAPRGSRRGKALAGGTVAFGEYGLQALEPAWVTTQQLEAARVAITRFLKRGGKVWIRVFPDKPFTEKRAETRRGSGKGNPEGWVAVIKPGRILFEIAGVSEDVAREAMRLAGHKLPIRTTLTTRPEGAAGTARPAPQGRAAAQHRADPGAAPAGGADEDGAAAERDTGVTQPRNRRKEQVGGVVSDRMQKTRGGGGGAQRRHPPSRKD